MMYDEDLMDSTQKRLQWDAEGRPRGANNYMAQTFNIN